MQEREVKQAKIIAHLLTAGTFAVCAGTLVYSAMRPTPEWIIIVYVLAGMPFWIFVLLTPWGKLLRAQREKSSPRRLILITLGAALVGVVIGQLCIFYSTDYRYRKDAARAKELYWAGNDAAAWEPARRALPGNDLEVLYIIGFNYLLDQADPDKVAAALELLRDSAARGFGLAQSILDAYDKINRPEVSEQARFYILLQVAARHGDPVAARQLEAILAAIEAQAKE